MTVQKEKYAIKILENVSPMSVLMTQTVPPKNHIVKWAPALKGNLMMTKSAVMNLAAVPIIFAQGLDYVFH